MRYGEKLAISVLEIYEHGWRKSEVQTDDAERIASELSFKPKAYSDSLSICEHESRGYD